jgi:hypothetical protein
MEEKALIYMQNKFKLLQINMETTYKHPMINYQAAFKQFSLAEDHEFSSKRLDSHVLILYEGVTYQVSHFDDFLDDYKFYFKSDYDQIYTETPAPLWDYLISRHLNIAVEDLVIAMYEAWKFYWEKNMRLFNSSNRYKEFHVQSWEDFQVLARQIINGAGSIVKNAVEIDDMTLIPVIALAVMRLYSNAEDFFKDCVTILIEKFPDHITDGDTFETITLEPVRETFYIYNPMFEYDDAEA